MKKDIAKKYFKCGPCERAAFEAGIKLGAVYHQFVGTPLDLDSVESLKNAIRSALLVQPFVEEAEVDIDTSEIKRKKGVYKYYTLKGEMLRIRVIIKYESCKVVAKLEYVEDMKYPLMYIEEVLRE